MNLMNAMAGADIAMGAMYAAEAAADDVNNALAFGIKDAIEFNLRDGVLAFEGARDKLAADAAAAAAADGDGAQTLAWHKALTKANVQGAAKMERSALVFDAVYAMKAADGTADAALFEFAAVADSAIAKFDAQMINDLGIADNVVYSLVVKDSW